MSVVKKAEIFKEVSDYSDFNKHIEYADFLDYLSEIERDKLKDSYKKLQKIFGDFSILKNEFSAHPIIRHLSNDARWSKQWLIWLTGVLEKINNSSNYTSLQKRLINPINYNEALSVIEVADRFFDAGFEIEIDKEIMINNRNKVPDLYLKNSLTNESLYVEVSELNESQPNQNGQTIVFALGEYAGRLLFSGRLLKSLSAGDLKELISQIRNSCRESYNQKEFRELNIPGIIELGVAPPGDKMSLETWYNEKNFELNGLIHPEEKSPVQRIANKLSSKKWQLPADLPNIIYLKTKNLLVYTKNKSAFINEVQALLSEYKNIFGIFISEESFNRLEDITLTKGLNLYVSKPRDNNELLNDKVIFLLNKYSEQKVSLNLLDKIMRAITQD